MCRLVSIILILVAAQSFAQRSLISCINATSDSLPIAHTPLDNQRTIEPYHSLIDEIEHRVAFIDEPSLTVDTLYGTIPYNTTLGSNGRIKVNIPIPSFSSEYENRHGLSLDYDNISQNSPMGYGWTLGGLPQITRTGHNHFTDGMTDGPSLSRQVFQLNGVRLLEQSAINGTTFYRTQIGNTRAVLDAAGNFTVFNPDGSRDYFLEHDSLRYYVTRHISIDGQEILYTYRQSVGYKLLSSVNYGEGRTLRLTYSRATIDKDSIYSAGVAIKQNLRLDSIIIGHNGKALAKYSLKYKTLSSPGDPFRLLTLTDSHGHRCVPLRFSYHGAGEKAFSHTEKRLSHHFSCDNNDISKIIVSRGRFDYGCEDEGLLMYANRVPYRMNANSFTTPLYTSQYLTNDTIIATTKMDLSYNYIYCGLLSAGEGFVEALAMDVNGYKGDELVRINNVVESDSDVVKFSVFAPGYGTAFIKIRECHLKKPSIFHLLRRSISPKSFVPGDFDGDGRMELLVITHTGPHISQGTIDIVDLNDSITAKGTFALDSCYLACPSWTGNNPSSDVLWQCYNSSARLIVLDIEGCGKHVLGVVNENGMYLYSFGIDALGQYTMTRRKAGISLTLSDLQDRELTTGDFNGDGISDLAVLQQKGNANYSIYYGKGDGSFVLKDSWFYITYSDRHHYAVTDVDRDGKSDIFVQPPYSGGNRDVFLSGDWVEDVKIQIPGGSYTTGTNAYVNGNNSSLVSVEHGGYVKFHHFRDMADVRRTLAQISDSVGQCHTFIHKRLYYYDETPYPAYAYEFPFNTFAEGALVCAGHRIEDPCDTLSNISYQYGLPVMHRQGIGFCGYDHIFSTDTITGNRTYVFNEPYKIGTTREIRLCNGTTDLQLTTSVNSMHIDSSDKYISILENCRTVTDFATDVIDSISFIYDDFNNISEESHSLNGNITRDIVYERYNRDSVDITSSLPYVIGLETRVEETVNADGRSVTTGHRTTYDNSCLVSSEKDYLETENNAVLTRTYTRDSLKRITEVTTIPYSGTQLKRYLSYAGTSRLPKSITDEKNILSTYTWSNFGVVKVEQMPDFTTHGLEPVIPGGGLIHNGTENGLNSLEGGQAGSRPGNLDPTWSTLTTSFYYNSLGQIDSISSHQGVVTRLRRGWQSLNDVKAVSMTEISTDGQPLRRIWHDASGRCVRSSIQRFDGSWLTTDTVYDFRGRVARASLPWCTDDKHWTVFSYDNYDRPTMIAYPDGHTDCTIYDGLHSTATVDGTATDRTFNSLGQLVSVTDASGTSIEYDLYPDGRPAAVTIDESLVTTFEYDNFGRQTAINDPSAGRREKQYDDDGNVIRETDARGRWVAATYNSRRQPVTRTTSDGMSATFTYDNWGSLISMTDNKGHSTTKEYDDLQLLRKETMDGYSRTYTYDSVGRVATTAHALNGTTICTEVNSYDYGTLSETALAGGKSLWKLVMERENGLPGEINYNNAITDSIIYDTGNRVTLRKLYNGHSIPVICQGYTYDTATVNLSTRTLFGHQELFSYDNLNRLTSDGIHSFSYDNLGNITARGGAGTMTYNGTIPYAATFLNTSPNDVMMPMRDQYIGYNAMQLPDSISESGVRAVFSYRGDAGRSDMVLTDADGDTIRSANYRDRLEVRKTSDGNVTQEKSVLWLAGTAYDAPAALVKGCGSGTWVLHYVVRDNLGSIIAVTDTSGTVLQRMAYDAWGMLRNPSTGETYMPDNQPELLLGRGYTGHEHLPEFGLINMNARLYDPATGRFLSPDPMVQLPDDTQSYNRYSYCLNNPLRYSDPTGLKWLMSKFGKEYFLFYDSEVNDIEQLNNKYGYNSDITIIDDGAVVTIRDKETGAVINEFDLFQDGSFTMDGVVQNQEYNNDGLLHIGTTTFTDKNTISDNWHGSYLGPNNPMLSEKNGYSYAVPPKDLHDYFAFQHDKDYDKVGAVGTWDAIFNSSTLEADLTLATKMLLTPSGSTTFWGPLTYIAFTHISIFKQWRRMYDKK